MPHRVATRCSALQPAVFRCNPLSCVATRCPALQHAVLRCNMLLSMFPLSASYPTGNPHFATHHPPHAADPTSPLESLAEDHLEMSEEMLHYLTTQCRPGVSDCNVVISSSGAGAWA